MNYMRTCSVGAVICALLMAACLGAADAKADEAKRDDIRKLLVLMGTQKMAHQAMAQMSEAMRKATPGLTDQFWDEFLDEANTKDLVEMCIPAYENNLKPQDIKGLIAFYESETGRAFTAAQPKILQETMAAGQMWGAALGKKIAERIAAEKQKEKKSTSKPAPETKPTEPATQDK